MKKCFINGTGCVSSQKTINTAFLEEIIINENDNIFDVSQPDYKEFIAPAAARRMAKGVKNGIVASASAIKEAGAENLDAIITGTGMGCSVDSEKFLKALIDNKEEFLTPTSFIQSTHNTVGGQIAIGLQCKAYNFTYVNGAVSFESSLIDAKMQIEADEATRILVGGVEESSENTLKFLQLSGVIKNKDQSPYSLLDSDTNGTVFSEGAVFFVLENEKKETTYAELKDVSVYNILEKEELEAKLKLFLNQNSLSSTDIDAVVLGYNGDAGFDDYYATLAKGVFATIPQVYYKHLSGEFNTASAFGLWVASHIIKMQQIPHVLKVNTVEVKDYKNILLYNQYRGYDHSFTLISKC
ncbi:beta-ketoacyl synthase N-terminal-like domain-containing protein [Flavobacterium sp. NRK1]|uniref:beta-ketoacyl synthase N-terminal-like domain-containing protein n=1 Tax=Flavobacterium sp. NRK1 TaxID=2954929 RepID=UPI002092EF18|nr:beta-ketoacyl synthase N-terminal-like domain-containing protein [Flavobacterium sp. NRK1]MCO6147282.1 beta-ketoacyl synthase chain length factor [Flavobacterium sp. NRK1]